MSAPRGCSAPAERAQMTPGTDAWRTHVEGCLACRVEARVLARMERAPVEVSAETRRRHLVRLRGG